MKPHLPGDAAEDKEETVVEVEAVLVRGHRSDPVLLRLDDVPHCRVVPGEGDTQPLCGHARKYDWSGQVRLGQGGKRDTKTKKTMKSVCCFRKKFRFHEE